MKTDLKARIHYLDGMRGVAILLVVLFHTFSRWPTIVPYGNQYGDFVLTRYGGLGVVLFFMISGFVIPMTLEKCSGFGDFLQRRWLRLFPGMLIVTLLIFSTASLLPERPSGLPQLADVVPGLLFIEPTWISALTGHEQGVLEGAFWSLFVEVKFYLLFGGAFFLFGGKGSKIALAGAFLLSISLAVGSRFFTSIPVINSIKMFLNGTMTFAFTGWFLVGVLTWELHQKRSPILLVAAILTGVLSSVYASFGHNDQTGLFCLGLVTLFIGAVYSETIRKILSTKFLVFVGFISYPLYLFHESFLVATVTQLGAAVPSIPGVLLPLLPFAAACSIAYVIATHLEPLLRGYFKGGLDWLSKVLSPRRKE